MNKYICMNEFNYYFSNLIFNIFNIFFTFILYENNVFGIKTISFFDMLFNLDSELLFYIILGIIGVIPVIKHAFKNFDIQKIISFKLLPYKIIFVSITIILLCIEYYLYNNIEAASFQISVLFILSNMCIFHLFYVLLLHPRIDSYFSHSR